MKRYDKTTPASTRDLLFDECEELRRVQRTLCALYEARGLREVMTPALEFYDVFGGSHGQVPPDRMVKLCDTQNRLVCMRPDCTVPIARMVGTKLMGAALPIRLYYNQQVFSAPKEHAGKAAEFSQVGVELIGAQDDMEILTLAGESLAELGAAGRLEICHVGIFKALMVALEGDEALKEQVRELIGQKSYVTLEQALAPCQVQPAARALLALPRLFGKREIFARARAAFEEIPEALTALTELEALYDALCGALPQADVALDLGLVDQTDYYTGAVFRGYVAGIGEPVLSGGRYDKLLRRFGRDLPATGFGVNASLLSKRACIQRARTLQAGAQLVNAQCAGEDARTVTLALTKGRLEKETAKLLAELGYDCSALENKGRRLVLPLGESGVRVILAKAADVVTYVESGVADMGVVGKDTIMENGGSFYEVLDLGFGRCRFAVACKEGDDVFSGYSSKVIASKYPRVALSFFEERGMDVEIVKIEGSVELAPLVGLADAIVDIVETGDTLRENGLHVAEEIAPVSARLIVNTAAMKLKQTRIEEILTRAEGAIASRRAACDK